MEFVHSNYQMSFDPISKDEIINKDQEEIYKSHSATP
jgi:hypothetical protein